MSWALPHQSLINPTDLITNQSDGGTSSVEVSSFQMTRACVLTKTKQNKQTTTEQPNQHTPVSCSLHRLQAGFCGSPLGDEKEPCNTQASCGCWPAVTAEPSSQSLQVTRSCWREHAHTPFITKRLACAPSRFAEAGTDSHGLTSLSS